MTELRDLLDSVAGSPAAPTPDIVAADAQRGRRALLRRRSARAGGGLVLAAAVAFGVTVLPDGGDQQVRVVAPGSVGVPAGNVGVDLVPFAGPLHGAKLRPAEVPTKWTVGGNELALVVAAPVPAGTPAPNREDYRGKLVVMLEDESTLPAAEQLPTDKPIAVGDRTGYIITADPAALQVYVPVDGRPNTVLRAQAPLSLRWDNAVLARWLSGVTLLDGVTSARG